MSENKYELIEKYEKEKSELLKSYLIAALKDVKKYMKLSDEEIYQRGSDLTKDELKECELRILKYLDIGKISQIINVYIYFTNSFSSISKNFAKCDKIIVEYRRKMESL